ncbi:glutamate--cysteine ligase [Maritalea porphyrae]|uniref:Glutamate--cysteine ligase n=1 Tax=Maritalea porphyrae TaxID=880732 RepID=A0ABQ5UTV9_9HYPH|nr:glutamate--cysteine ligase [Maritalea porphyrae]GLQ17765.1 glutamate--cysteine ligase [Maritalea porphyrae]
MSASPVVSPLIESKADLIEALSKGEKPKSEWRIGTEHEKFVFCKKQRTPATYDGPSGIKAILEAVQTKTNWSPLMDKGNIIGLKDPVGGGSISLEPGGQLELSGAPLETLHETCQETGNHLKMLRSITDEMGLEFLGLGVAPAWSLEDMPMMPKSRYGIMKPYMEKVGTLGTSMMFRSCTVQVNLDFSSEIDMVKKLRTSLALQPITTAMFANSPFVDGKPSGYLSYRAHIWQNTDKDRTGMLPFAFEDGMGYERYVDYALDVPMYFIIRDGEYVNCAGESFRDFLEGKLPQRPGELPTIADWEDHLSTIFPEVRLKSFLEMRGADSGPWEGICALPALWVGVLYDQSSLDAAWDLVKDWTAEQRDHLRVDVAKSAFQAEIAGRKVGEVARDMLEISRNGLAARARQNWEGFDEGVFLHPVERALKLEKSPAEVMLDAYYSTWDGDIEKVYTERLF